MQGSTVINNVKISEDYTANNGIALYDTETSFSLTGSGGGYHEGSAIIQWSYDPVSITGGFTGQGWTVTFGNVTYNPFSDDNYTNQIRDRGSEYILESLHSYHDANADTFSQFIAALTLLYGTGCAQIHI